jgi:formamidopyrimidine-DNA glycosylase
MYAIERMNIYDYANAKCKICMQMQASIKNIQVAAFYCALSESYLMPTGPSGTYSR